MIYSLFHSNEKQREIRKVEKELSFSDERL